MVSTRTGFLIYTVSFGLALILALSFIGITPQHQMKYLILLIAVAFYFATVAILTRYKRRKKGEFG